MAGAHCVPKANGSGGVSPNTTGGNDITHILDMLSPIPMFPVPFYVTDRRQLPFWLYGGADEPVTV
eukprot:6493161-Pyramimonas_sp.AAC.1